MDLSEQAKVVTELELVAHEMVELVDVVRALVRMGLVTSNLREVLDVLDKRLHHALEAIPWVTP